MASWRHRAIALTMVAMGNMAQYDCDPLAEPAERLERCLERAVKQQTRVGQVSHVACDLKISGKFTVVLHPPNELSNDELVWGGMPENLIPELRTMRQRRGPAMYVIASDAHIKGVGIGRTVLSSRTYSQSTFVEIPQLMVVTRSKQPLTVEIGKTRETSVIRRIR